MVPHLRRDFEPLVAMSPARPPTPVAFDGQPMASQGCRSVRSISIFGELWVARHSFTATGQARSTPLDADLSLPATAYSDLLREWGAHGDTEQATLADKAVACADLAQRATQRDGAAHIQHRVALTDEAEALQAQMQATSSTTP